MRGFPIATTAKDAGGADIPDHGRGVSNLRSVCAAGRRRGNPGNFGHPGHCAGERRFRRFSLGQCVALHRNRGYQRGFS